MQLLLFSFPRSVSDPVAAAYAKLIKLKLCLPNTLWKRNTRNTRKTIANPLGIPGDGDFQAIYTQFVI